MIIIFFLDNVESSFHILEKQETGEENNKKKTLEMSVSFYLSSQVTHPAVLVVKSVECLSRRLSGPCHVPSDSCT